MRLVLKSVFQRILGEVRQVSPVRRTKNPLLDARAIAFITISVICSSFALGCSNASSSALSTRAVEIYGPGDVLTAFAKAEIPLTRTGGRKIMRWKWGAGDYYRPRRIALFIVAIYESATEAAAAARHTPRHDCPKLGNVNVLLKKNVLVVITHGRSTKKVRQALSNLT